MHDVFAERLRQARKRANLSQAQLAKRCGLPPSQISHFETGSRTPRLSNLVKFADALDVSCDFLAGRCDEANTLLSTDPLYCDIIELNFMDRQVVQAFVRFVMQGGGRG